MSWFSVQLLIFWFQLHHVDYSALLLTFQFLIPQLSLNRFVLFMQQHWITAALSFSAFNFYTEALVLMWSWNNKSIISFWCLNLPFPYKLNRSQSIFSFIPNMMWPLITEIVLIYRKNTERFWISFMLSFGGKYQAVG